MGISNYLNDFQIGIIFSKDMNLLYKNICVKVYSRKKASNVVEKCSVENTFFKKILRRIFSKISKCSVQKPDAVVK